MFDYDMENIHHSSTWKTSWSILFIAEHDIRWSLYLLLSSLRSLFLCVGCEAFFTQHFRFQLLRFISGTSSLLPHMSHTGRHLINTFIPILWIAVCHGNNILCIHYTAYNVYIKMLHWGHPRLDWRSNFIQLMFKEHSDKKT